jgi:phosphopantetheine adenylyltransferase
VKVYETILRLNEDTAITLGTFDGLHIGHVKIIKQLVKDANERNLKSVVYTFKNHPLSLNHSIETPSTIFKLDYKQEILEKLEALKEAWFESKEKTELGAKAKDFIKKIEYWHEASRYLTIDSFIEKLLRESNFLNYISALPGGNLRRGNLKLLIQKAKIFSNSASAGLFYFVKFIEKMEELLPYLAVGLLIGIAYGFWKEKKSKKK